jgi:hypothetical protein
MHPNGHLPKKVKGRGRPRTVGRPYWVLSTRLPKSEWQVLDILARQKKLSRSAMTAELLLDALRRLNSATPEETLEATSVLPAAVQTLAKDDGG